MLILKIGRTSIAVSLALLLLACETTSQTVNAPDMPASKSPIFQPGQMAEDAPAQLMHWGKLVGQWTTEEEVLRTDGSGWDPAGEADWDLFWAYDGWGIQDNYTSPPKSQKLEDESKRQRGTNLRVYDPATNTWALTWLTASSKKAERYTAMSNDSEVVMLSEELNTRGQHSRITFFDMSETNFEWKLEQSKDKENWIEVYRIHGTKKN